MSEQTKYTIYDMVTRLIGPIHPAGATHLDDVRYKNLEAVTELVDKLLFDIANVGKNASREEMSIKKAGEFATKFMQEVVDAGN